MNFVTADLKAHAAEAAVAAAGYCPAAVVAAAVAVAAVVVEPFLTANGKSQKSRTTMVTSRRVEGIQKPIKATAEKAQATARTLINISVSPRGKTGPPA